MLHQRELFYIGELLKQIKCDLRPFGGVIILLVCDPAQLPPVQGYPLWFKNSKNQDDVNCHHILLLFDTVVELEEDMRLD